MASVFAIGSAVHAADKAEALDQEEKVKVLCKCGELVELPKSLVKGKGRKATGEEVRTWINKK